MLLDRSPRAWQVRVVDNSRDNEIMGNAINTQIRIKVHVRIMVEDEDGRRKFFFFAIARKGNRHNHNRVTQQLKSDDPNSDKLRRYNVPCFLRMYE